MAAAPDTSLSFQLTGGEKIYFASDFHLGGAGQAADPERERKIIRWLDEISDDAKAIFLVGDIFDFWFEYKHTIPKGFIRFQGKLAELKDKGIPVYLFTGNHDLWMSDYFPSELNIPVFFRPVTLTVNDKKVYLAHGDGLGPGENVYKFLKWIFTNRFFQWLFYWVHPNIGVGIAKRWSGRSRIHSESIEDKFKGEEEPLFQYCKEIESQSHHDLYVFGHRHLPLEMEVSNQSTYFNLGEWVHHFSYLELDENEAVLKYFDR